MRLLLDTHAFLWFVLSDSRLSLAAQRLLADPGNVLLLSPASYWEMAIKVSLGKYAVPQDFETFMEEQIADNDLTVLPISVKHAAIVAGLPFHHRDPFDRLLVAQAIAEQVPIISNDPALDAYPVTRLW
jgi:PIN domain nuclease of toxin-antitoxin system